MTRRALSPSWVFGGLSAALSAGYGVLFTIVGDYRDAYGISETAIGVIIGIGFLAGFVSQVFIAPIADRGFARRLIIVGVLANVIGLVGMAFGETLTVLIVGRVVSGLGIGTAVPAIRRVVILADPDNVGQSLGRLLSADVFGFATGPAISAVLVGPLGLAAPFVVVAALTVVGLAVAAGVEFEDRVDTSGQRFAVDLLRAPVVAGAVVLGAAVFLMIGAFDALWDLVHEDLETATWMANLGITLFALPLVVLGPFSGRLAERVGPFRIGGPGLLIGAMFIFLYGQLPSGAWIFGFGLVHAVFDGLTVSSSGVAIAMAVKPERQAGAQGVMGAAQALTAGITAIIVGALYESHGRAVAYGTASAGMIVLVAIAMWLARDFWIRGAHRAAA